LLRVSILACVLVATGTALIVTNAAPVVPASSDAVGATLPYVVKLHANWCPICMTTKGAWASMQNAYTGRVRFVVFDFSNDATTNASRAQAQRLGLGDVFDEYAGETGTVLIVDAASRKVRDSLHGHRSPEEYGAAIDAALKGTAQ